MTNVDLVGTQTTGTPKRTLKILQRITTNIHREIHLPVSRAALQPSRLKREKNIKRMMEEQAKLDMAAALLAVAETAILKAHAVLNGTLRQRISQLHQDTIDLKSAVIQKSVKYEKKVQRLAILHRSVCVLR